MNILNEARNGTPDVLYMSNETEAHSIISVAKESLNSEDLINCYDSTDAQFDVYRNCFRDISIDLNNKLMELSDRQWFITIGSVNHCFMISNNYNNNRDEYFFKIANIYFEIFKYKDVIESQTNENAFEESFSEENQNLMDENVIMDQITD